MGGELAMVRIAEQLAFPLGGPIILTVVGLLLVRRRPHLGRGLAAAGLGVLLIASLPVTGRALITSLEVYPALKPQQIAEKDARAIVILAGGRRSHAPEYGGETVSPSTLERVRYGAWLHRNSGLPVLVTGGSPFTGRVGEAVLMKRTLREFGIDDVSVEDRSRNTAENARYTARLLGPGDPLVLVTHAAHMARAKAQFEAAGLTVIPAPTGFTADRTGPILLDWLPSNHALALSSAALHEWAGRLWYALRY